MDLGKILRELKKEKRSLEAAIQSLEILSRRASQPRVKALRPKAGLPRMEQVSSPEQLVEHPRGPTGWDSGKPKHRWRQVARREAHAYRRPR